MTGGGRAVHARGDTLETGRILALMRMLERVGRVAVLVGVFAVAAGFALQFGAGGLWSGLEAAHAVTAPGQTQAPYDLTQLVAVNETLKTIRDKYVEPARVKPRQMFLSALNQIQKEVAPVIVLHESKSPRVKLRVYDEEREFRVDNVQGPWDVAARLREVFAFMQAKLKRTGVKLRDIEYAACNGMLLTLDPHSVFMSPDAYREMNLSTSGHFGGLGIVISIRDQMLTIIRPMPGTPAGRAGLKRYDRITKINNESTLNMPLDDAVKRLRGKPGTQVTIWVHREEPDGWRGSRPFELVREEIHIESVQSRVLAGNVGYVRVKQFQSSTDSELERALDGLRKKGQLRGLVLDLRGNPGGLLDQAAKVADRFLDRGVIVSTVGTSEGREQKTASSRGTEPDYPLVVLADGASASASEIVAGALRNHDRAIVVGETTFGKGTVQLVFPRITPDGAALKLTIAQYLMPGDVSIQGVGVAPDIELDPMTADVLEMDLFRSEGLLRERDLSKSLTGGARRSRAHPFFKLRFNMPEHERAQIREFGTDRDDEVHLDYPVRFARDLLAKLQSGRRPGQLRRARAFLDREQEVQVAAVAADLEKLGIDWSAPPLAHRQGTRADDFEVRLETDRPGHKVTAGEPMKLRATVHNRGKAPIYRLRATTKSDSGYYDERELVFGKLEPGQTKTAEAPFGWCEVEGRKPGSTKPLPDDAKRVCRLPMNAPTRQDVVKVQFFAEGGEPPQDAELRPTVTALPRPVFAYAFQVVDNRPGNGDGQLARGEGATIYLTVKNVGTGRSYETQANLANLTGDGLLLHAGRFDISNLEPGDTRQVAFTFDVLQDLAESYVKVEISVADRDLLVLSGEKVTISVTRGGLRIKSATGRVMTTAKAVAVAERLGSFGEFTKIRLEGDRFGFVLAEQVSEIGRRLKLGLKPLLSRSPPLLEVATGVLATRQDHVTVEGVATDGDRVLDAYIFVGARKVYYHSNGKDVSDPRRLEFKHRVKLQPGVNVITVVARENEDTATRYTRVVRRDGPQGEALPTPKGEEFGADWEFISP
jgi:carboxyl-terminal processing protease